MYDDCNSLQYASLGHTAFPTLALWTMNHVILCTYRYAFVLVGISASGRPFSFPKSAHTLPTPVSREFFQLQRSLITAQDLGIATNGAELHWR